MPRNTKLYFHCTLLIKSFHEKINTVIYNSCDGRVVKALDLKSNGDSPRRFESCSQRILFLQKYHNKEKHLALYLNPRNLSGVTEINHGDILPEKNSRTFQWSSNRKLLFSIILVDDDILFLLVPIP